MPYGLHYTMLCEPEVNGGVWTSEGEVTWSRGPSFIMKEAAAFCTRYDGALIDIDRPAIVESR